MGEEAIVSVGGVEFTLPLKSQATDNRRVIYEKWFDNVGLLQVLHVKPDNNDQPLGLHFHRYTKELFSVERGGGEVLLASVDDEGRKIGFIDQRQLEVGTLIEVVPKMAHTFYLKPDSVMTCVASHKYDQNDAVRISWLVKL